MIPNMLRMLVEEMYSRNQSRQCAVISWLLWLWVSWVQRLVKCEYLSASCWFW
jgi:hypothetical protein